MENQSDIGSAFTSLSEALKKRERELDEKEAELSEKRKRLEVEITDVYGNTGPSDVLHLNVGGQRIDVLRRTLCSIEGSMLASRFSGRWDDSLEKDENGHFFIDQEYNQFKMLIDYLRDKAIETENYPVSAPNGGPKFYRLLDYFGLTDGIYPTWFEPWFNPNHGDDAFMITKGIEIDAKEWCHFELKQHGHLRSIKSFELRLGEIKRLQIGLNMFYLEDYPDFVYSQSTGVGDEPETNALDPVRSCVINEGERFDISGLEVKEGSMIKIELEGNWYFDGKLVASHDGRDGSVMMAVQGCKVRPAISIKGKAKLVNVAYTN